MFPPTISPTTLTHFCVQSNEMAKSSRLSKKPATLHTPTKARDTTIDYLRSVSILVMIVLHINPYFPKLPFSSWFINYGQWVVPAFIFCSLAVGSTNSVVGLSSYLSYVWRRLKRLLIPYYLWLATYLGLFLLLGHKRLTLQNVLPNIFFTGGIDFNWLILLFIYITLMLPVIERLVEKSEKSSIVFIVLCGVLSIYFIWSRSFLWPNYRFYMFIPWCGVTAGLLLILRWIRANDLKKLVVFTTINLVIFLCTLLFFTTQRITLNSFNHKYPPDIYYFSYCLWTTPLAYFVARKLSKIMSPESTLSRFLTYVSSNSYTIFFVHLIVLYILNVSFPKRPFNYLVFSLITFGGSLFLVRLLELAGRLKGRFYQENR